MLDIRNAAITALMAGVLNGCGSTRQFVDQPHATTLDEPQEDARHAIVDLFGPMTPPYSVKLCEADPASRECKKESKGIAATGVGGLLLPILPLTLHVRGMEVERQARAPDGLTFAASLDATVDAIAPLCGTVEGRIISRDNDTASFQLRNFYCNWAVVGNVIVNADLSVDSINVKDRIVTGFYKITFHGTGNATGSGYYKAVIVPKSI
jgi:hypothetical protein